MLVGFLWTFVFKFLRHGVDGKHLMRFQSPNAVFKFLLRSDVDGIEKFLSMITPTVEKKGKNNYLK